MKRFRVVMLLAAVLACTAYQGRYMVIYAAPGGQSPANLPAHNSQAPTAHATDAETQGAQAYVDHCAICHGEQREGILPAFPPLLGIGRQMTDQQITSIIHTGKGRMPGFPKLQHEELAALMRFLAAGNAAGSTAKSASNSEATHASALSEAGGVLFLQNCAFCHGRDAAGGETGPDLTRSKLVRTDIGGDKISEVVRDGRPEKKMPAFNFSNQELSSLAAFIHAQESKAASQKGARRGVEVADLQTGNAEEGKRYFNGAGTCATCHSAGGDLAGIASRYEGLQLEERMLYPKDAKSRITVTLPSGQRITGNLVYQDEFTVGLRDGEGSYHSWPVSRVKYTLNSPAHAHVELFSRYTDADIHNLMAYLQTLR